MNERGGPGADGDALSLECAQVVGGHMLVIEGHDRHAIGQTEQGVQVIVAAEDHVSGNLGG